jgi:ribosomal protein S27AE
VAKHEYARTCKRCGDQWFVAEDVAKAKPRKQARMAGWFVPIVGARRQQLRADGAMIALHNQELAKSRQCPACGSASFDERKVRI